ncbi:MAG: hypothetical protein ACK4S0_13710, partial [Sediminibacterium sp.]
LLNLNQMSKRENEYSKQLQRKTSDELILMLQSHEKYVDELLMALLWELESRGQQLDLMDDVKKELESRILIESDTVPDATFNTLAETAPPVEAASPLPVLFSQTAILGFTLFFSPITGGILMALNIARLGKKGIWPVIVFSIVYSLFQGYVSLQVPAGSIIPILLNVAGGLILSELLWNNFIGKGFLYQRRNILIPLLIVIAIFAPVAWYVYQNPELLNINIK